MTEDKSDKHEDRPAENDLWDEGEIAADYLEELLDIVDQDGDIDISVSHNRACVSIVTEEPNDWLDNLVGEDGEVLQALQNLTRLAVQTKTGERSRLVLDIAGYREQRRAELEEVGHDAIAQCRESGKKVHLDAMNPYERKVIHDLVAAEGLHSESDGVAPNRHVVISLSEDD